MSFFWLFATGFDAYIFDWMKHVSVPNGMTPR